MRTSYNDQASILDDFRIPQGVLPPGLDVSCWLHTVIRILHVENFLHTSVLLEICKKLVEHYVVLLTNIYISNDYDVGWFSLTKI